MTTRPAERRSRRSTPRYSARESESRLPPRGACETLPPPLLYPASLEREPASLERVALLGAFTERISATLQSRLRGSARRSSLLASTLRVGVLSREEAARALRLELDGLDEAAAGSGADSLRALVASLRDVVEELGEIAGESSAPAYQVAVLDPDAETASFIALALESYGHRVRLATKVADLERAVGVGAGVDALFVAVDHSEAGPGVPSSRTLRLMIGRESLPVVVYGRGSEARVASLAARAEADCALRIDVGIDQLLGAVGALLERLLRSPATALETGKVSP